MHDAIDAGADRKNYSVVTAHSLGENGVDCIARLGAKGRNRSAESNPERLPGCKAIAAEPQRRAKDN